jgi:alpha-L-rhamnosidase
MSLTWSALPIAPDEDFDGAPLRTEFGLEEGHGLVARATLHATAQGVFEAHLNGEPVSDDVLSPGWSSYEWRLRYRSYDVTSLLQPSSVLGIALGNGWFRGRLGWSGSRAIYGKELAALAQLEIEFSDGYVQTVVTDESWAAGPSAVIVNDLYDGETIDARRYSEDWLERGFSDKSWTGVHRAELDYTTLTPYIWGDAAISVVLILTSVAVAPVGTGAELPAGRRLARCRSCHRDLYRRHRVHLTPQTAHRSGPPTAAGRQVQLGRPALRPAQARTVHRGTRHG